MENKLKLDQIPPDLGPDSQPSPLKHTDSSVGKKAAAVGSGEDPKGSEAGPTASEGRKSTIWTEATARSRPPRLEPPSKKPSLTVPGMDTPIDVLLNRYLSGQSITLNANGTYNEQLPPEYDHFDRVEKAQFAKNVNKSLDAYESELRQKEKAKETAELDSLRSKVEELQSQLSRKTESPETNDSVL